MGLDLTIAIISYPHLDWWLARNTMSFNRDYELFQQIIDTRRVTGRQKVEVHKLPERVNLDWYGEQGVDKCTTDAYGGNLTMLYAKQFKFVSTEGTDAWNRAIIEMLRAMPEDIPVILYWH